MIGDIISYVIAGGGLVIFAIVLLGGLIEWLSGLYCDWKLWRFKRTKDGMKAWTEMEVLFVLFYQEKQNPYRYDGWVSRN